MTAPLVTYAVDGRVGIVSLDRPEKLNAIDADMKRVLVERLHEADRSHSFYASLSGATQRQLDFTLNLIRSPMPHPIQQSLYWHEHRSALVLDQEHQECRRSCVPANDMNVVESVPGAQARLPRRVRARRRPCVRTPPGPTRRAVPTPV